MHLKQLKLAGFKSFVDPTVIPFSSQLVAVVGPNGCGKSNVIDAVRWVMGESSVKNLRGASMIDVIFNGSSQRKSVGQATVELVFDNRLGRLAGPFASYQEISVKRLVTRDGESAYFLNGSRCRRRDITDIFLGTGAGARGYSIIGQDTISRLIEAHPDELRVYFEEAAGVSKYKERRRETMLRMNHTRENLTRVMDIRDELARQLERLASQAKTAEQYLALKQQERQCRSDILALKWQALTQEQQQVQGQLTQWAAEYEQHQTKRAALHQESAVLADVMQATQTNMQETQATFYQLKTDMALIEEQIRQQQREKERLLEEKQRVAAALQALMAQLQQDQQALLTGEQALLEVKGFHQSSHAAWRSAEAAYELTQQEKATWDVAWQTWQMALNHAQRDVQLEQVRLQHLEERGQQTQQRVERVMQEKELLRDESLHESLQTLQTQQQELTKQHQQMFEQHQQLLIDIDKLHEAHRSLEQSLQQVHDRVQALATEHAVLLAAQQAAFQPLEDTIAAQWSTLPRVAEVIEVSPPWQRVCEWVLGERLTAVVLDSMSSLWVDLPAIQGQKVSFVQADGAVLEDQSSYPKLIDYLTGILPSHLLANIFAADCLADAIQWLPSLLPHQSIVTPDGYWLGAGWVQVAAFTEQEETSVLARQQTLARLSQTLAIEREQVAAQQATRDHIRKDLAARENEMLEVQRLLFSSEQQMRAGEAAIQQTQQAISQGHLRQLVLNEEHEALQGVLEEIMMQKIEVERRHLVASQAVLLHEQQLPQWAQDKLVWEERVAAHQRAMEKARTMVHEAELALSRDGLKAQQLRDNIEREQRRVDSLQARLQVIMQDLEKLASPEQTQTLGLHDTMIQYQQVEMDLARLRQQLDTCQQQEITLARQNKQFAQQEQMMQERMQQQQLHEQSLAVRAAGLLESLTELGDDMTTCLAALPSGTSWTAREQALLVVNEAIHQLGAINLMAIEEHQLALTRQQELEHQCLDLTEALALLDEAIVKMDEETQSRLKDMFDQINTAFQALFPRLFGGGHARLEWTCDNLLEAGILVMAQPPGKRNSSIQLLSGGEKAMTAVALVFAIFQMNPSPFCMLDEVDAPLDEANVRRFCDLVKEMSEFVQFLFITHNKVTMELADHLIGVTMREPGVSRVVTVDVEETV